ncbi:remorin-like isoform X1 [Telopea speciosissima]|uniref:remorin-like isoform X1 n=1 Tax=Telopea speciosissima TaxID=54955 RepID=UPI001CC364B0|nr:remorin-like isoform X1 [Telopea speciosissima]XP_043717577.1 remorin-like isoform X1 [Telopea speciosissima]
MGDGEPKKETTVEVPSEPAPPSTPPPVEGQKDAEEKTVIPPPTKETEKVDDSKALTMIEKVPESTGEKSSGSSNDRDAALARLEAEKRLALIKAWEESEKTKAENKAHKKLYAIESWENSKKAAVEAKLKKIEEKLEKQKAEYVEKMKNEVALIHKEAEEKRAMIEAKRGEDLLKAEEIAAKYRATGNTPKTLIGCFGS